MLLLDELQRLPEVVLGFVVVPHGVVGVRNVLAECSTLAQNILHLVEQRKRLLELRLLPQHERHGLHRLQLVLVGPLPALREDIPQVGVQLVEAVELDAVVEKSEEGLECALVLKTLLFQQLLVSRLQLYLILFLLLHSLGVVVVVLQTHDVEVGGHDVGPRHLLFLLLRQASPLHLVLLLAKSDDQSSALIGALQGPEAVVHLNFVRELLLEDALACEGHGEVRALGLDLDVLASSRGHGKANCDLRVRLRPLVRLCLSHLAANCLVLP
mmetsp:Transcript_187/g.764  ORF Transcript_187/g.764 Transcript_187/m.764 type:complete len:270 (+) Transcript_187:2087-2896(+)